MSFIDSFFKKSKLEKAIKQSDVARKKEGAEADHRFQSAYQEFAGVIAKDLLYSETLYHWGFALLHQAKTKTGEEAVKLYEEAIAKFSFCLTVDPDFLGAAVDGGVAYMDLARIKGVASDDSLYAMAERQFQRANTIQKGTASYNLACIFALRNEEQSCQQALEDSRKHGSLPSTEDIWNDPDLDNVKQCRWFAEFMTALATPAEPDSAEVENTAEKPEAIVAVEAGTAEEAAETEDAVEAEASVTQSSEGAGTKVE